MEKQINEHDLDAALKTTLQTSAESRLVSDLSLDKLFDEKCSILDHTYSMLVECKNTIDADDSDKCIDRQLELTKISATLALVDQLVLLNRSMPLIAQCIVNSNANLVKPASGLLTR